MQIFAPPEKNNLEAPKFLALSSKTATSWFVNEEGTEAAAASAAEFEFRMMGPAPFIADEPFIFAIVKNLKTILFVGRFAG
ncbi:unnamed protein product [Gongylonema pulchrum]|uniref:SERPIN domain-containing protein n=1 Tax=Gongylonema pulchrum TaxID=637853 RepID=A0A183DB18_9BILA|nr:unnamed protein product [Gongylonema pulchrum]